MQRCKCFYLLVIALMSVQLAYAQANSYQQTKPLKLWYIQQQEQCKEDKSHNLTTFCVLNSWIPQALSTQIAQSDINVNLKKFGDSKAQLQLSLSKEKNEPYATIDLFLDRLGILRHPINWQTYLNPAMLNKGTVKISYPLTISSRQIIEFIGFPRDTQLGLQQLQKAYPAQLTAILTKAQQTLDIDIKLDIAQLARLHMNFEMKVDNELWLSPLLVSITGRDSPYAVAKNKVYPSELTISLVNNGFIEDVAHELLGDQALIYSPMLLMNLSEYFMQMALLQRDPLVKKWFISLADFILLPKSLSIKGVNNYQQDQSFRLWQNISDWLNFHHQWYVLTLKQQQNKSSALQQEVFRLSAQKIKYKNRVLDLFRKGFSYQFFSNGVEIQ